MAGRLSIGTAWSEAAAFVRRERRLLAPVVLGLILLPAVISTMVQPPTPASGSPEPGAWMFVAFAMILVMMAGQMAIVLLAEDWRGSIGEAIGRAARRLPTLIAAAVIVMLPMIVILSVVLAAVTFAGGGEGGVSAQNLSGGGGIAILLAVVLVLLIAVRLLPLVAVIARGTDGPISALKQTFRMTRGQFWKLLGFFLLMAITFVIVAAAVGAVFGSIVTLALGRPDPWTLSLLLIALIGGLVQAAFVTIYTAMLARIAVQLEGERISGT
ncbi:MAG: hypothetical protein M3Q83_00480 [Pseudomonadota bacterium]|nr:hypothetical protein [Pseudomonadota bacterium]